MKLKEYRCANKACGGKLLFRGRVKEAALRVKCPRCGRVNVFYFDMGGKVRVELRPEGMS